MKQEQHSLFIQGRLWHDKVNGNMYWSTRTEIDGQHVMTLGGLNYGYGSAFIFETLKVLGERRLVPVTSAGELRDLGWAVYTSASYGLKSELFKGDA